MATTPDRLGADVSLLGDATEGTTPQYPYTVDHNGGYFDCGIQPDLGEAIEIDFQIPVDFNAVISAGSAYRYVIAFLETPNIILSLAGTSYYPNGFHLAQSAQWRTTAMFQQGITYRATIAIRDADNLDLFIQRADGGSPFVSLGIYGATGAFTGPQTIYLGYPKALVLNAPYNSLPDGRLAPENLLITQVQPANLGPTGIALSNSAVSATAPVGTEIGTFTIAHARPTYLPMASYMGEGIEGTGTTILKSKITSFIRMRYSPQASIYYGLVLATTTA